MKRLSIICTSILVICVVLSIINQYANASCNICKWLGYILPCIGLVFVTVYAIKELKKEKIYREENYLVAIIGNAFFQLLALAWPAYHS